MPENKTTNVKLLKCQYFVLFPENICKVNFGGKETANISILTILHLLGIASVLNKSLSASLKKMDLTDIGL